MKKKGKGVMYSAADLFRIINKQLEEKGLLPGHLDYALPTHDVTMIKSYEWDCIGVTNFGGCEGIYLDLFIRGFIGDDEAKDGDVSVGTYKTLRTDKEAFIDMTRLNAEFVFALKDFVNEHIEEFNWHGYTVTYYSGNDEKACYCIARKEYLEDSIQRTVERCGYDRVTILDNYTKETEERKVK